MNMTADQLNYVLERKYKNIRIGMDVVVVCTVTNDLSQPEGFVNNPDAVILEWNVEGIAQPDETELNRLWDVLKDQYHSDATRHDSDMYNFVNFRNYTIPSIEINEDI